MSTNQTHENLVPNWDRALFVQRDFDEELLKELTPQILRLRSTPGTITIGLDSFGGEIRLLEALVSLLKSPDLRGDQGQYICVVTHHAFSAAALLLTWADYSIAYPHSAILFHDTRFTKLLNVTPSRALETARDLQIENDRLALILAKRVTKRLVWVYIDKYLNFELVRERNVKIVEQFSPAIDSICPRNEDKEIDVLGFALTLLEGLESETARQIVLRALRRLTEWISIERIEREIDNNEQSQERSSLIAPINRILGALTGGTNTSSVKPTEINLRLQNDLKLILEIILKRAIESPDWSICEDGFGKIEKDFELIRGLRAESQAKEIVRMMLESKHTFLGTKVADLLIKTTDLAERKKILSPYYPQAKLFWYFAVLLCKTMFEGENMITARDAQLLGVVDEVVGGGPVESRREFSVRDEIADRQSKAEV